MDLVLINVNNFYMFNFLVYIIDLQIKFYVQK